MRTVIVTFHVASGAWLGARAGSRARAIALGAAAHLAGDLVPHYDFESERFELPRRASPWSARSPSAAGSSTRRRSAASPAASRTPSTSSRCRRLAAQALPEPPLPAAAPLRASPAAAAAGGGARAPRPRPSVDPSEPEQVPAGGRTHCQRAWHVDRPIRALCRSFARRPCRVWTPNRTSGCLAPGFRPQSRHCCSWRRRSRSSPRSSVDPSEPEQVPAGGRTHCQRAWHVDRPIRALCRSFARRPCRVWTPNRTSGCLAP